MHVPEATKFQNSAYFSHNIFMWILLFSEQQW